MAWEVLHKARVMYDSITQKLGIQCGCGGEVFNLGNTWSDVTSDFTWDERIVPLYYAALAGNNIVQLVAEVELTELISEEVRLFETTKWHAITDSSFPIMKVRADGTVAMIEGTHDPGGYITADLTGVATSDKLYINIFVPVD